MIKEAILAGALIIGGTPVANADTALDVCNGLATLALKTAQARDKGIPESVVLALQSDTGNPRLNKNIVKMIDTIYANENISPELYYAMAISTCSKGSAF